MAGPRENGEAEAFVNSTYCISREMTGGPVGRWGDG